MTGPVVPSDEDELREALAAVLSDWRARYGRAVPEADELIAALDRRGVELTRKGHPDCVDAVKFVAEHHHGHDYPRCAADRERYANQRAAEELETLAFRLVSQDVTDEAVYEEIGALRAALTAREEAGR